MVKPMGKTPTRSVWLSSLDLVITATYHSRWVNFYRFDGATNFFDTAMMKAALNRTLVEFYPYAGRLRKDDNGRLEINCNGEGVVFIESECDGAVDDLGGFSPRPDVSFVPKVDYSNGISSFPLFLIQLTRFKCGGVTIGFATQHHVSDGISSLQFIITWSEIARGLTPAIPPSLDRRLLSPRNPPRPQFPHIEHHPPLSLKAPLQDCDVSFSTFRLTRNQIRAIKWKCGGGESDYTVYEVVAGHVWRCATAARGLPGDQQTKLHLPVNARGKLRPALPPGFLGNGIFFTSAFASCGELTSRPLRFAAGKVHEAIARMDDEYLRSAIDYVELNMATVEGTVLSEGPVRCPNLGITSWVRLPFYEVDFGHGKPVHVGPGAIMSEGKSFLIRDPQNEGGVLLLITLLKHHMKEFTKLIYGESELVLRSNI